MRFLKTNNYNSTTTITINNEKSLNALNTTILNEIDEVLSKIEYNKKIKTVIITGAGNKAFVAGADITEMAKMSKKEAYNYSLKGQKLFSKIENFNKPIIAAVNGFALGGGCELALACHIRYASENAFLGQPEVKLGLIAGFGGTQRLGKIISRGKAFEILLTGKMIDSKSALKIGLIDGLFKSNSLLAEAKKTANLINTNSSLAVMKTIELVNKSYDLNIFDGLTCESIEFSKLFDSSDTKEGIDAFINKRKPKFE
jgi:enoyl-CoA hydratase